jgi:hypothetical protein
MNLEGEKIYFKIVDLVANIQHTCSDVCSSSLHAQIFNAFKSEYWI